MPRPYSTDLRERALAAYEGGEGSQAQVASRYRLGERTLSGWLRAARGEGRRGPKPHRGGRAPVGGAGEVLAELVAERNDATLAEYAALLDERAGVRRSPAALCRALKALGLVRKKRRSGPPSRTARTWRGNVGTGACGSALWILPASCSWTRRAPPPTWCAAMGAAREASAWWMPLPGATGRLPPLWPACAQRLDRPDGAGWADDG